MQKNISDNTGKGKDRKGTKARDGLKLNWRWLMQCQLSMAPRNDKRRLPCQTCFAIIETSVGTVELKAIDWHDEYEAYACINGERMVSERGFTTRVKAQAAAEGMLRTFAKALLEVVP